MYRRHVSLRLIKRLETRIDKLWGRYVNLAKIQLVEHEATERKWKRTACVRRALDTRDKNVSL